jgi:hypothetical protein
LLSAYGRLVRPAARLETDYLVVGAGTIGMGFVDTLLDHSDADVVMIDRRHAAGGHWLDAYPFVQLHQPSRNYGVNSTVLGRDRIEPDGREAGFYERAAGTEICGYYDEVMRHRLLASGRVRFFPMCEYLGDRWFRSELTGADTDMTVRKAVVDATYMASRVPATDPPPFAVADGVACVPVGELVHVTTPPAGYVIVGAGKTAMDAVCWLLDRGTPPGDITWIRPREAWLLNREFFQPGEGVLRTFEGVVVELETVVECDSIDEVYERLEDREIAMRIDPSVRPEILRGATISRGELDQLRRVEHVVRLGYVERIDRDAITLTHGSVPTSPGHLHVHCASRGLSDNPPRPVFTDDDIALQVVTRVSLPLSAALIAYVESTGRTMDEKNRLCPPNPWPQTPFDFTRHLLYGMRTEMGWTSAPDVVAFVEDSRTNLMQGLAEHPERAALSDLQRRFLEALMPALDKLDMFATHASDAERARMYEPAAVSGR